MFKVLPFKPDSTGAKILVDNLPGELLDPRANRVRPTSANPIINWGCGWSSHQVSANQPSAICNAVNKLRAFELFRDHDVPHPSHTRLRATALKWLQQGHRVYARETMEGERGRGITVVESGGELPDVGTFVKGFLTHREFRIHVAFGKTIEVNEKKRRNGTNPDPFVRSSSDWVFCVYNLAVYPDTIMDAAVGAVSALGLDFGGVDLAINSDNEVCVFEVNTAPWINRESSTNAYCNAFRERFAA